MGLTNLLRYFFWGGMAKFAHSLQDKLALWR
jgi:hypothetical protein